MRALARLVVSVLLLAGCVGGEPRRPGGSEPRRIEPEVREDAPPRGEDERWSVDAALPRSGDPARPNVKVEVTLVEVASRRDLVVRAGARGSLVRGVVSLRAALEAGAGEARARSRTSSFIVVQAGRAGCITLAEDARRWCGAYAGLEVQVLRVGAEGAVELALALAGGDVGAATTVTLAPGQAVLLGGSSESDEREARGLGRYDERASSRETLVLLQVDVLG